MCPFMRRFGCHGPFGEFQLLPRQGHRFLAGVLAFAVTVTAPARPQVQDGVGQETPPGIAYRAFIPPTGDPALDALLRATSGLIGLQGRAPTDGEGLLSRMAAEAAVLRPALDSEGYWAGRIEPVLVGVAAEPSAMLAAPAPLAVEIRILAGPRYRLRRLETEGGAAPALSAGQPARAETVLSAQDALLTTLRADARPLARIERVVTVDHAAQAMDIRFTVSPGPQADFAQPTILGTERVNPEVVRRVAALRLAGQGYSPGRLARARADVAALGPFASVRIDTGEALDRAGRLPVSVTVRERPFRVLSATAAYESNFGVALRGGWEHRNFLGGAESLRLELEANRLGNALDRTNARAGVTWRQPLAFGWDGTLIGSMAAVRERLDSYDRDAVIFSLLHERRLGDRWTLATGPVAEAGRTGPPGSALDAYQVMGWAVQARYDSTRSLLDPRAGIRAQGSVIPSYAFVEGTPYVPVRLNGATYFDLLGEGRGILAMRAGIGSLVNARAQDAPPSQRFFAGGGGSVRGYDFQSIGPRDARGRPLGGASLLEGSIEWRQRFGATLGGVAFVDTGAVGTRSFAPTGSLRVGAGLGVRYYTAIGPIRADIALPLVRQPGSGAFGLYIGIGHAF